MRGSHVVIAIGVLIGFLRIFLVADGKTPPVTLDGFQIYKDAAHLFMGGLLVAAWRDGKSWQWSLFWLLNAVEIACAIASR